MDLALSCEVNRQGQRNRATALLLPSVLVNIIVIVVYFYPRLRIRYPEVILVVIIEVSEAGYMTFTFNKPYQTI